MSDFPCISLNNSKTVNLISNDTFNSKGAFYSFELRFSFQPLLTLDLLSHLGN